MTPVGSGGAVLAIASSDRCGVCRRMKKDLSEEKNAHLMGYIVFLSDDEIEKLGVTAFPSMFKLKGGVPDASTKMEGYGGVEALANMIGLSGGK